MQQHDSQRPGPLQSLAALRPGEGGVVLLAMLFFFCVLAAYYVLRPIRDAMGIAGGVEQLPWMFLGTLVLTLLLNPLYAGVVARVERARLLAWSYRALMLCLLGFFALVEWVAEDAQLWIGRAFYWWVSVFNVFAVSLFWTLLIDCLRREQARRMFGLIAAGGTLGALLAPPPPPCWSKRSASQACCWCPPCCLSARCALRAGCSYGARRANPSSANARPR